MASAHAIDGSLITPAQVWARVTAEQQQQIVRLLAHLAVHVIGAETPWRVGPGHQKEATDVRSPKPSENPARPS